MKKSICVPPDASPPPSLPSPKRTGGLMADMAADGMTVREAVLRLYDEENRRFQSKLTPGLPPDAFLGARVPELRKLEKQFRGSEAAAEFLRELPHRFYDENLLHAVFLSNCRDKDAVIAALEAFLPYVDNWAVCDTLRPTVFRRDKRGLTDAIVGWISSDKTYTCRFGIDMLMTFYLDADFLPSQLALPLLARNDDYYVRMMQAWYYATALAKQWEATLPYLTNRKLPPWVHNKTIQKARESYRISDDRKHILHSLRLTEEDSI